MHQMEHINRRTWRKANSLKYYSKNTDYETEGEQILMTEVARRHFGGSVLDLGCGGGRTANLVKHFANEYLGVDYTPEMVSIARANHPGLWFDHMDARDLSALHGANFDLVLFSYNGIDSVSPEGRFAIFREVARVLKPGGSFAFSSFNRNWYGFDLPTRPCQKHRIWALNPMRMALRIGRWSAGKVRARCYIALEQRGEHAIMLHSAHDFGIMVYATTPAQLRQQLAEAGLASDIMILRKDGRPVHDEIDAGNEYFHVIARKS